MLQKIDAFLLHEHFERLDGASWGQSSDQSKCGVLKGHRVAFRTIRRVLVARLEKVTVGVPSATRRSCICAVQVKFHFAAIDGSAKLIRCDSSGVVFHDLGEEGL